MRERRRSVIVEAPVVPERRRGRPRADEACVSLSTWMPVTTVDRLIQLANQREVSVSMLVRQLLILRLP